MSVRIELHPPDGLTVDLRAVVPQALAGLSAGEIEALPAPLAGRPAALGESARLRASTGGEGNLILSGDTSRASHIGFRMDSGRLRVEGAAGPFAGAEMAGGELEVRGDAGDCLGAAMRGGRVWVHGDAGDGCGAALPGLARGMTGGTLVVEGRVGIEAGAGMRRGLLLVGGDCGESAGARLLAGTILCLGSLGPGAGIGMKRGSLVAGRSAPLLPGFRPAGPADPEWLRLVLSWLRRSGLPCPSGWLERPLRRFSGDHLVLGKGEILVHDLTE